jgi:hypothetical protein
MAFALLRDIIVQSIAARQNSVRLRLHFRVDGTPLPFQEKQLCERYIAADHPELCYSSKIFVLNDGDVVTFSVLLSANRVRLIEQLEADKDHK